MSDPTPPADIESEPDLSLIEKFPVLVLGGITVLVTAILNALVEFGIDVSPGEQSAIGKLVDALGALVILFLLYRRTVSSAKVISRVTNNGRVVAGEASDLPTGADLTTAADPDGLPVPLATVKPNLVAQPVPDLPYRPTPPAGDLSAKRVDGGRRVPRIASCDRFHPGEPCHPGRNHPAANNG